MFDGWPIRDFAASIGAKCIAVLVGYFDESGTTNKDRIALVGGAVADSVYWSRLETPWKKHLGTTRVSWFHAVECEHGEGEFAHIQRPLRESLVYGLSEEIAKIRPQCFGSGVFREDWKFATDEVKRRSLDDPYYFCFELCMQQISSWSRDYCGGEPVALIFAKHEKYQKRAQELHGYYQRAIEHGITGIGSITFADPKLLIELQVADLIAYELYRYGAASRLATNPQLSAALKNFETGGVSVSFMIHDRESLPGLRPRARPTST